MDLFIDIETYSSVDITACGAYKYIASPDFEIIILGYAIDDGPVKVIDLLQGELIPVEFTAAFNNPNVRKHAHNAVFERLAFKRIGMERPINEWYCTMVKAAYCGLPLSLGEISDKLKLTEGKLDTGKALIRYFSCPCKPTKINGGRTRNFPEHNLAKWEMYKEYNKYDVLAEREIYHKLEGYKIPEIERRLYILDQIINDRGIAIDKQLAENAVNIDTLISEEIANEFKSLTGVTNPNSGTQVRAWLSQQAGEEVTSLAKDAMPGLIAKYKDNKTISQVLALRNMLSKTSVKKYYAMINCAMQDARVRGTFQFYGANRTGRWAGRLLQLQNLSKNHLEDLDTPRQLVRDNDIDTLKMLYPDIPDLLSQLVRTGIVAPEGKILSVADFSAIEARVISWLADEKWRMDVFHGDGKIYEATGARMFGVPIKAITKGSELRQKSKISELALGYGGSVGALKRMGGERMGLSDAEMASLTRKWRAANKNIVKLWNDLESAAVEAIMYHTPIECTCKNLVIDCDDTCMTIQLPSGRKLFYRNPRVVKAKGGYGIVYKGIIQVTKQWGDVDTYGGKLTENVIQAIARDLLGYSMLQLHNAGFVITMHIHDEVIAEVDIANAESEYDKMVKVMSQQPDWALDLPLRADGYLTNYYKKD